MILGLIIIGLGIILILLYLPKKGEWDNLSDKIWIMSDISKLIFGAFCVLLGLILLINSIF
ncbi:hypothetical protein CJ739_2523 [Mariniflexile rhizosphaerae]|nr:hypothetical protein CJ739_2523 [Mariniflexile sp. TRM1-10]